MVRTRDQRNKREMAREGVLRGWKSLSDREIARILGISNGLVSQVRRELVSEGRIIPKVKNTHGVEASLYEVCTAAIEPAKENDQLYDPVDRTEPSFLALVENIRENGILEPLVASRDGYILSGHRRHAAAEYLEMDQIPVRIRGDVSWEENQDEFIRLLASYNRQRVKTSLEQVREEVALQTNESTASVRTFRRQSSGVNGHGKVRLRSRRSRSAIREKLALRAAIIQVLNENRADWPISDRKVHYFLLNFEGLVRNDRTRRLYVNDADSYDDTTNMVTRMRLDGSISFEAIADETRPVVVWDTHRCVGDYIRRECEQFMGRYWRDLLQSQPNWVELLVEKNTVASQLRELSSTYTLPMTSGRGYSSLPPRKEMVDRFRKSGREKLVVIVVSDHDPEGDDIPSSFGISLRDDFRIKPNKLEVVKAALTAKQVASLDLHEGQMPKASSSRYKRFVEKYGERCWELEALPTETLRGIVEETIRNVLAIPIFEREVEREKKEQQELEEKREQMRKLLLENA